MLDVIAPRAYWLEKRESSSAERAGTSVILSMVSPKISLCCGEEYLSFSVLPFHFCFGHVSTTPLRGSSSTARQSPLSFQYRDPWRS